MKLNIGDNIGPWIINKIIKTEYSRSILQVYLKKNFDQVAPMSSSLQEAITSSPLEEHLINTELGGTDRSCELLPPNSDICSLKGTKYWIMKITYKINEYEIIKKYKLDECDYIVKTIKKEEISNGKYDEKYYWYIMEEYCFDCSRKIIGVINIEKKIVTTIVNFLRYLHIEQKAIHGDIKLKNVLYKNDNYAICDFESVKNPNNDELCDEYISSNYYYYYIGCEYKRPIWSYRTDLEAVGYILWYIINKYHLLEFQKSAQYYYENEYEANRFPKLETLKYNDYENIPDIVNKYFEITSKIDWFNLEPPSNEIYDEIIKLFDN